MSRVLLPSNMAVMSVIYDAVAIVNSFVEIPVPDVFLLEKKHVTKVCNRRCGNI